MTGLDLRVRLLGWVLERAERRRLGGEIQSSQVPDNLLTRFLFGGRRDGVTVTDTVASGAAGPIPARIYEPAHKEPRRPVIIHFHGGGWVHGSLRLGDWLCSNVAHGADAIVASVDYRLAPKNPWPAAAADCYAALVDLSGRLGADDSRLAVMGDSAGANLAAVTALMSRDRGGPRIAYQALLYPPTDLTLASPSMDEFAHLSTLPKRSFERMVNNYLQDADARDPYASPLFATDHHGLPAALIQVAEYDILRDDGMRYAAALRAADIAVSSTVYQDMPHGYMSFPRFCRSAPSALDELCSSLLGALR